MFILSVISVGYYNKQKENKNATDIIVMITKKKNRLQVDMSVTKKKNNH